MMTSHKSEFIQRVEERGFMHQCTDLDGLDALALDEGKDKAPPTAYIGFDCTAPSLHAGSLVSIMLLRLFQQAGHKPIVLMNVYERAPVSCMSYTRQSIFLSIAGVGLRTGPGPYSE